MTENLVVSAAVENTSKTFDKLFDYAVPSALTDAVSEGKRILVPFGGGNRRRQAMIMGLKKQDDVSRLKLIDAVLDEQPVLTREMLRLADFMRRHCFCTYYEAIHAMLPAGMNFRVFAEYSLNTDAGTDISRFSDEERRVIFILQRRRTPVKEDKLRNLLGYADNRVFEALVKKGALKKQESAMRKTADASQRMAAINEESEASDFKLTLKQQQVYELLSAAGALCVGEICYFLGVTRSVIDALAKKNLIYYFDEEVYRPVASAIPEQSAEPGEICLTEEQTKAFEGLYELYCGGKPSVSLLYGVTGSGKTSVFMKLVERVQAQGRGVIVMVPEIALTPQLIGLFKSRFAEQVAVIHSGLSLGERLDEYKRLKNGTARIAVGTRSAVFAPIENIGLIIMDEEQEHTYKSEAAPRFHARDIAKFRCVENNCLLVLSSATPSVETFYHAKSGRYSMFTLNARYGGAVLPRVIIEDMNIELALGNQTSFSARLIEELQLNLDNKQQSILLLNRRGHNTFLSCPDCKEVVVCPNCSISLTYHSANRRMMCHYCGYSAEYDGVCPNCGGERLRFCGAGTQKAEQELLQLFPKARVLRMDADATLAKFSHEKKLNAFAQGEYDILIGTQMVAKGLNFPNVTLVGVLNADQMLYSDDFRSYERAFSLLTQVVGRSGRGSMRGRAVIQTLTPENTVISLASAQDYEAFYNSEINIRRAMLYPPFADICLVGFTGRNQLSVIRCASEFAKAVADLCRSEYSELPLRLLGPSAYAVGRVNNKYRYRIILKCRNTERFREMLSRLLVGFGKNHSFEDVGIYADMDPVNF